MRCLGKTMSVASSDDANTCAPKVACTPFTTFPSARTKVASEVRQSSWRCSVGSGVELVVKLELTVMV